MLPDGVYKTLVILINLLIKSQLTIVKRLKKTNCTCYPLGFLLHLKCWLFNLKLGS